MKAAIATFVAAQLLITGAMAGGPPITPDPHLTPGAVLTTDASKVCVRGYARSVRNVSFEEKRAVYREYHLSRRGGHFEVDHLISLELGGSNDIRNLWPESYDTPRWNAHTKDHLENALHRAVCDGRITLQAAQIAIATDWIGAYQQMVQHHLLRPDSR